MWRKMQLLIACGGTVTAVGLILAVILILIGGADLIEWFFLIYLIIGFMVCYKFLWPYYSRNLKLPIED